MPQRIRAVSPQVLAGLVVDAAGPALDRARAAGTAVRLGVDGAVPADTAGLADLVVAAAVARGVPAARVRAEDFLHRRSVRLEHGPHDVDTAYERWVDWQALQREVLEPLADPQRLTWLPRLRDAGSDRPARQAPRAGAPGLLVVLDGPFLLRWELAGDLDVSVHLATSDAALRRRLAEGDPRRGAWRRYLGETDPESRADLVVRAEHPERPALVTP